MTAITDKFKKTYNSGNPNVTFVTTGRSAAATTLICDSLTGWPTDTAVDFITYQLDTDGETVVAGSQRDWKGIVSSNTITELTLITGGADAGSSVNDIVEMTATANWANDLVTGITTSLDQDGTLKAGAVDVAGVLASNVVTTAKILDSNVTTAKILDSNVTSAKIASDAVTDAKLVYGKVRSRQGGSSTNWQTAGTTTYDYSATNTFIQVGSMTPAAQTTGVTFPTAFSQLPLIFVTPIGSSGVFSAGWYVVSTTTTGFNFVCADYTKVAQMVWMAVGE